ncbi:MULTISPECIES: hypothetical protein [Cyanophyceae]|uniref:hypothetical protein n=1 Tax=Cyanophyceae TaxID=3028117 RepID=UPI001682A3AE|nr:hypothetical protein [Trichocoleus sp. FACHB-69]MBD1933417.1 hypothetical protein [Trichocoleus sp. FACHB-69]
MAQYTDPSQIQDEDNLSLLEIIRFFRLHWKFLGLTTVVLSSAAIILFLLKPQQYQKQLTLSVKQLPVSVSSSLSFLGKDVNQTGIQAVKYLQNQQLDKITVQPRFDASTQQVDVTLQSKNTDALAQSSSKITSKLKTQFQNQIGEGIEVGLTVTEQELKRNQQVLAQIKQQIAEFSPTSGTSSQQIQIAARLDALEQQRARLEVAIVAGEVDKKYLMQAQKNLAEFTNQVMSVQIVSESDLPLTRSILPVVVFAIVASFMVAVVASIIGDQIPRLQHELSKAKIDGSKDV